MSFIWAAIGLGFVSSFHCIGMCGPIALALPIGKANPLERFF
ncbi:MAG: sulfite exporter TauE/SafE family protein, partial [Bacteroidota bacterium]